MTPEFLLLGLFFFLITIALLNIWVNKREKRLLRERAEERRRESEEDRARAERLLKEKESAPPSGDPCPKCHLNTFETRVIGRQYEKVTFGTCAECGFEDSFLYRDTCPACGSGDYFEGSYTEGDNDGRCYACGEIQANAIKWVALPEPETEIQISRIQHIEEQARLLDKYLESGVSDEDDATDVKDR